jgi:hypothetical protein
MQSKWLIIMTIVKQLLAIGLLFSLGIAIGAVFTPVGVDWSQELIDADKEVPVHQKQQSTSPDKKLYS